MTRKDCRPIIGITMGDPVGIGPEIILSALRDASICNICRPLVIGDTRVLARAKMCMKNPPDIHPVSGPDQGRYQTGSIDVLSLSELDTGQMAWGKPTVSTAKAMVNYIMAAVDMAVQGRISAVTTGPINKKAMRMAGFAYDGHTEIFAQQTATEKYVMMLAGSRLRVVLVTIHMALTDVFSSLTTGRILDTIRITGSALQERFGFNPPRMAVAGLNPHAGEDGLFGAEEKNIIGPAVAGAIQEGFHVSGPFSPDTVFHQALNGQYDVVVCMYHDQGLIPFKLIHFADGVNTTLGLPIIRTSVDHGTAYDIAGTGTADPGSMVAAIHMAAGQAVLKDHPTTPGNTA
ncbi:MAG: 4-hydroxythreonine-4-phosphate dehydrogenase PdxA [Desulfobacterales bacterium]|nr:4-hydroxythreonine-4-phosphate dehydrogenase PdxA [Desulfobacterales bacterium]